MFFARKLLTALAALSIWSSSALADPPVLRASVLQFGTVAWELDTIRHHRLDRANGFTLSVQGVAGNAAARVAFLGGAVDIIVADWLWVARQRAEGRDMVFIPYSKSVGGLMVPADSTARDITDLRGGKIGIAGGPVDKSWLILRAYARQEYGMDLAAETEQVFAAPPLIYQTASRGAFAGAINFWHFGAKMQAGGMRLLIDTQTAARALGLDPETPLLGYVVHGSLLRDHPDLVYGFARASRQAKEILRDDDAEWRRLRPRMHASSDAQFAALVAGFRAGISGPGPVNEAAATRMFELMVRLGGEALLGPATALPDGVFLKPKQ